MFACACLRWTASSTALFFHRGAVFALAWLAAARRERHRFVCIRRLKSVRKQFNEYRTMKRTLLYLTVALLSYALVVVVLLAGQHVTVRRVAILCESCFGSGVWFPHGSIHCCGAVLPCLPRGPPTAEAHAESQSRHALCPPNHHGSPCKFRSVPYPCAKPPLPLSLRISALCLVCVTRTAKHHTVAAKPTAAKHISTAYT